MPVGRREEPKHGEVSIILGMLSAVERDSSVTQRHLAQELGIAVGLANAYIKRCAKKGFIKIRQVPLNRYAYYLTPRGFAEKSRLTAEYLTVSFDFFRRARLDAVSLLSSCHGRGWTHVALWGAGELAEVMILSAAEARVDVICVIDPSGTGSCGGRPVVADLPTALSLTTAIDTVVVTDARMPRESFEAARTALADQGMSVDRVVAPEMLRLSPVTTKAGQ